MREITVDVCQGIGDIFWAYQKLAPHFEKIHLNIMCFDQSAVETRAVAWPSLWPKIGNVKTKIVSVHDYHEASDYYIPLDSLLDKREAVYGVNYPLEQGSRLEAIDDYPVAWDVPIQSEEWELPFADCWAVYVSGSLYSWTLEQWIHLIRLIRPPVPLILIGASYDRRAIDPLAEQLREDGIELQVYIDLPPARVIHLLQHVTFFLCYQSGLGILADNLGTKQFMMYFPQLQKLEYAWCRPGHEHTIFHAGNCSRSPAEIAKEIRPILTT